MAEMKCGLVGGGRVAALWLAVALLASCASDSRTPDADARSGPSPASSASRPISETVERVDAGRVLVVFYSQGAATRRVAEDLAELTGADLEEITEPRERRGFFGFMRSGAAATFKRPSRISQPRLDPAGYDHVYVCTPVWAWSLSPPVRAWLVATRGSLRSVAFVTVASDTEPDKIAEDMARTAGVTPFAVAGFNDPDFRPENAAAYQAAMAALVGALR